MQGRLSPLIDNKIQAFPHNNWKNEFQIAQKLGYKLVDHKLELYGTKIKKN